MNKDKLARLIKNPFALGAAIFVLNIPLGWILITILMLINVKNDFLSSSGGIMAAFIIGSIHATLVKEQIPAKTKIIAAAFYGVAAFLSTIIFLAAAELQLNSSTLAITGALNVVYAIGIYVFLGLGEKGILKSHSKKPK